MKFCPKCNSVMKAKGNKMVCIRCGYEEEGVERIQFKERISHDKDRTIVADGKVINGRVAISYVLDVVQLGLYCWRRDYISVWYAI